MIVAVLRHRFGSRIAAGGFLNVALSKDIPCLVDLPGAVHRRHSVHQLGYVAEWESSRDRLHCDDLGFDLLGALVIPMAATGTKLFVDGRSTVPLITACP
jgi:hypothetical protein